MNTPRSAETRQILNTERTEASHSHALRVGDEVMSAGCWSVKEDETEAVIKPKLRQLAADWKCVDLLSSSSLRHATLKRFAV